MSERNRGQAIVETAIFVPLMLLLMLSIIYLSQAGVAQERGQAAVRYGTLVSPAQSYSLQAVYAAYHAGLPTPVPFSSATACPGTEATDVAAAVNQAQTLPSSAPTSFPTTQPFWQVPSPSAACRMGERQISQGFYPGLTAGYVETMKNNLSASLPVPGYLQRALGTTPFAVNSTMTSYLPLTLNDLIYCTPGLQTFIVPPSTVGGPQDGWGGAFSNGALANPLDGDLDINHTMFTNYAPSYGNAATPPPQWTSPAQDFNYQAQTGMGSGPLGCENY